MGRRNYRKVQKFAAGGLVEDDDMAELTSDMYSYATRNDTDEKIKGTRFHDSGMRIPGRQKGRNDNYGKRGPKRIEPMINEKWRD